MLRIARLFPVPPWTIRPLPGLTASDRMDSFAGLLLDHVAGPTVGATVGTSVSVGVRVMVGVAVSTGTGVSEAVGVTVGVGVGVAVGADAPGSVL